MNTNMIYRIEPTPAVDDIEEGLAAPIHDPLWMMTRQWQLGEFQGNDAGSPAFLRVRGTTAAVSAMASGVKGPWQPYDRTQAPLDVLVEADGESADLRGLLQAGAHFNRLLTQRKLSRYVSKFQEAHAIDLVKQLATHVSKLEAADPLLALLARSAPEPTSLATALTKFVDGTHSAASFVSAADRKKVGEVAREWLDWYEAEKACTEVAPSKCWEPHRLEHHALMASSAGGKTVLRTREYCADSLDWVDFDIDTDASAPRFALPKPEPLELTGIPTPIRYGGMPAARYWELEDGRVDFGNVEAGAHDLGRLLLVEFAMVFGNDWFLVPLRIPSGTLTLLDDVLVTDVFGENYLIQRAGAQDPNWNLFTLDSSSQEAHASQAALLLPPSFGLRLESEPLETVHLLRDEMANMAWAVERRVGTSEGAWVDRLEQWRRRPRRQGVNAQGQPIPPGSPDQPARPGEPGSPAGVAPLANAAADGTTPRYLVETEIPDYWIPMVPEQLEDHRSHRLVLVPLASRAESGLLLNEPHGELLAAPARNERFWLYEEEVPRAGISVDRTRRYLRWHGGRSYLWSARSRRTGRGEGSSGLKFDVVLPE